MSFDRYHPSNDSAFRTTQGRSDRGGVRCHHHIINFQNNSAQCMPRINKEKGKKHHKKNGGNVKTIRASAAERRGA